VKFKTQRQRREWRRLDKRLKGLVRGLDLISQAFFKKELTVTEVFRTQKENNKIYGDEKHISVHTFLRGVDIRTSNLTKQEAQILADMANCIPYDPKRKHIKTAKFGDKLHSNHIHAQVRAL
jgi:hypothetical protein